MKVVIEEGQRRYQPWATQPAVFTAPEEIVLPGMVRFIEYQMDQMSVWCEANPDAADEDEMPIESYIVDCDVVAEKVRVWDLSQVAGDVTNDNYTWIGKRVSTLA